MISYLLVLVQHPTQLTLFPYTTLFRSDDAGMIHDGVVDALADGVGVGRAGVVGIDSRLGVVRDDPHRQHLRPRGDADDALRSEEHTSELQSRFDLVCRHLLEKKKNTLS